MRHNDFWISLKSRTAARIALGRAGGSLPTKAWLEFRLAHAKARDAVFKPLDTESIILDLRKAGQESVIVSSCADTHQEFLLRPDKGRTLAAASQKQLSLLALNGPQNTASPEKNKIAVVVCGGLSASAAMANGPALVKALVPELLGAGCHVFPLVLVQFGRVALGDEIAAALQADMVIMIIGERPGLETAESLGAYLTYRPSPRSSDADRNCVSNIHGRGLRTEAATAKILWLVQAALASGKSGVLLKDFSDTEQLKANDEHPQ